MAIVVQFLSHDARCLHNLLLILIEREFSLELNQNLSKIIHEYAKLKYRRFQLSK